MSDRSRLVSPLRPPSLLALLLLAGIARGQGRTDLVSYSHDGSMIWGASSRSTISPDGRFVVFESYANNLVFGDTNYHVDVFLHDRQTGSTVQSSVSSSGAQADSYPSYQGTVSDDGRYVAFRSYATNLVPLDRNGVEDIFVHDHWTGTTRRASVDRLGVEANDGSFAPSISGDGRFLAFASIATNLVPDEAPLYLSQVYLRDLEAGGIVIASIDGFGGHVGTSRDPSLSADGRTIAFHSYGLKVPGDTVQAPGGQIYVRDLTAGVTTRVSVDSQGHPAKSSVWTDTFAPSLSGDGRFVAFQSRAGNLVAGDDESSLDVFVHDRGTATTTRVSVSSSGAPGNGDSDHPHLSADGRFVTFSSLATNLVPDDGNGRQDVFVHDLLTGATTRISVATDGGDGSGGAPSYAEFAAAEGISADGRFVAFSSWYSNLAVGDTNIVGDVFVHDRAAPRPNPYCTAKVDSQGCLPGMSSTGLASASSSVPFEILASPVQAGRRGFLFYSLGPDRESLLGGTLCIARPLRRAAILASGGNAAAHDCTGSLSFDFNAFLRSGVDLDLVPGTVAYAQYFYRDPTDPAGTGLSDALRFAILP